jgi:hypothetical protein
MFPYSTAFRLALEPTQPPVQSVPGVKQLGCEAGRSPLSSADVKNGEAIPPVPHTSSWHGA